MNQPNYFRTLRTGVSAIIYDTTTVNKNNKTT